MTGSFSKILNKILCVISWCIILVIGSCLDSVSDWRVWAVLLISIIIMGVTGHELDLS